MIPAMTSAPPKPWENDYVNNAPVNTLDHQNSIRNQEGWQVPYNFVQSPYSNFNYRQQFPGSYPNWPLVSSLETGANSFVERLRQIVHFISNITQLLDSIIYAGYSSMSSFSNLYQSLKRLQVETLGKLFTYIRSIIQACHKYSNWTFMSIPLLIFTLSTLKKHLTSTEATAIHEYATHEEGHLMLKPGEKLYILLVDGEWCLGRKHSGEQGLFPLSCVQIKDHNSFKSVNQ